jgi:predicted RNA-binding Zn ribbon-like protein
MTGQHKHHFSLLGGHPAIDLVNTEVMRNGEMADLLSDETALADWLLASGVVARRMRVTRAAFRAVLEGRAAMRRIAIAVTGGKSPGRRDVAVIERELARVRGSLALHGDGAGFSFDFEPAVADVRFIMACTLASFLADLDRDRLRACGGARCVLFFYDTSRSGTRRWCTMTGCGNRAKASGHYQRTRKSGLSSRA